MSSSTAMIHLFIGMLRADAAARRASQASPGPGSCRVMARARALPPISK